LEQAMVQIRSKAEKGLAAVSRLLGDSWRRTYSPIMGLDTTARLSDDKHAPEKLAAELQDDNKMSFVAGGDWRKPRQRPISPAKEIGRSAVFVPPQ
jgi:hypothetical protein